MIRLADILKWLLTPSLIFASGCATIVSKSEYDIPVSCNMPGVTVNVYKGSELINTSVTPTVITLSSKGGYFWPASYRFEFVKGGGRDEVELDAEFDWWYLGNFILPYGILVALTVDPMTGAMWKFDDDALVYGRVPPVDEQKMSASGNSTVKAVQDAAFEAKRQSAAPQVKPSHVNEIAPARPVSMPTRNDQYFEVKNITL